MGRWAQAKRRGSCPAGATESPPIVAGWPVVTSDWDIDASGLSLVVTNDSDGPAPSDGQVYQFRIFGETAWTNAGPATPGNATVLVLFAVLGTIYAVRAAWSVGPDPVSIYSPISLVTITA